MADERGRRAGGLLADERDHGPATAERCLREARPVRVRGPHGEPARRAGAVHPERRPEAGRQPQADHRPARRVVRPPADVGPGEGGGGGGHDECRKEADRERSNAAARHPDGTRRNSTPRPPDVSPCYRCCLRPIVTTRVVYIGFKPKHGGKRRVRFRTGSDTRVRDVGPQMRVDKGTDWSVPGPAPNALRITQPAFGFLLDVSGIDLPNVYNLFN